VWLVNLDAKYKCRKYDIILRGQFTKRYNVLYFRNETNLKQVTENKKHFHNDSLLCSTLLLCKWQIKLLDSHFAVFCTFKELWPKITDCLILKMRALLFFEMYVTVHQWTRRNIQNNCIFVNIANVHVLKLGRISVSWCNIGQKNL